MRILYLTDGDLAPHKAPQIHVSQFLKHWHQSGCEVLLRAPRTQNVMPDFEFPHVWLPHSGIRLLGDWLFQRRMYRQLKQELKEKRWDVVYTRQMSTFPALYRLCRAFSVPVLCEVNGFLLENYQTGGASAWKLRMVESMERSILQSSSLVVVPYQALKERISCHYHLSDEQVIVIENGVDDKLFVQKEKLQCRHQLMLDQDVYYIGFVGSFDFYHDVQTMLDAFDLIAKAFPKGTVHYLMVGDGECREAVQNWVLQKGLSQYIHFVGSVPHENVVHYINAADIMVSLQPLARMLQLGEASSLKVKEYVACGVPVVLSHPVGTASSFEGVCTHIPPENAQLFANAVIAILNGERIHYDADVLGKTYSWAVASKNLLTHMKTLVK